MSEELQLDDRCQHISPAGRRCCMPRVNGHPSLCYQHRQQQLQPDTDPEAVAAELLGPIKDFKTAAAVNQALGRLFALLADNRISPRNAAILAYICQLLFSTLPAVEREIICTEHLSGWQNMVRDVFDSLRGSESSDPAKKTLKRATQAHSAKSRTTS